MASPAKKISSVIGGILIPLLVTCLATLLVKYKPWGVPDVLRDEYEAKVQKINERNSLINHWEKKAKPDIVVSSTYDVGVCTSGKPAEYQFTFKNKGEVALEVSSVRTTNNANIRITPPVIPSGEEGQIHVAWESIDQPGQFKFSAFFACNDPLQETFTIDFKGRNRAKILMPRQVSIPTTDSGTFGQSSLAITSELWENITILSVESELELFEWNARQATSLPPGCTSGIDLMLQAGAFDYGKYESEFLVTAKGNTGEIIESKIKLTGKVHQPIGFLGPELHMTDGLDLGTLTSEKEHQFHVNCRVNGDHDREIAILEIEPAELTAKLKKQTRSGNYRLSIIVPKGCPMIVFNTNKQGFIKVGDPNDVNFSNWLPIHGVVVPPTQ